MSELLVIAHDDISLHRRPADEERSPAARLAVEAFLELMRGNRVRPYDIATRCWTRSVTRHVPTGPRREIVRSFELAPPFWPVTVAHDGGKPTGYGIDRSGACIRYTPNPYPLVNRVDEMTIQRVQFAPGCQDLLRRATPANPVFICDTLPYPQTVELLNEYLIDAVVSLSEGRGPVAMPAPRSALNSTLNSPLTN